MGVRSELEPDDPMAFVGHQMVSMAAWGWRTRSARWDDGAPRRAWRRQEPGAKTLGRRRSLTDDQVQLARRMKDTGASGRKIAQLLELNEKTVRNALKAGP